MEQFGPVLWNFYGATETGLVTLAGPHDHVTRPGTIGRALRGNEIRLLDDAGHEVRVGEVGELYARNSMLISGYHSNDEATRSSQRDGFFSVGDLGRVDADGYYYLESRKHDMVISGGVNIYPREIEDHLQHAPGDPRGRGDRRARSRVGRDAARVRRAPRRRSSSPRPRSSTTAAQGLADFKRPRKVTFLAELPRNPTGKVLKRELRELLTAVGATGRRDTAARPHSDRPRHRRPHRPRQDVAGPRADRHRHRSARRSRRRAGSRPSSASRASISASRRIAVVDVPGHERFVKSMVAGATGLDLVCLVIAADEGVMPQTREHLDICELLGVRRGLIVLTKRDLVDDEWLAMVTADVRAAVAGTFLADAPIVPVSTKTGAGLDELRAALARAIDALPPRDARPACSACRSIACSR